MKKHRINKEDDLPSDEEISNYKDFGKLSHSYDKVTKRPKRPLYKDPKAFLGLLLIVIVVYIVSLDDENEQGQVEGDADPKDSTEQVENKKGPTDR